MNQYNIIIDDTMIQNIFMTDSSEAFDLLNINLFLTFFFLGIVPSIIIYKIPITYLSLKNEFYFKIKAGMAVIVISIILILSSSNFYTSFFREHKSLRSYINPTYYLYSLGEFFIDTFSIKKVTVTPLGTDAKIPSNNGKKRLVIMVVGEAARADHFSLNGYKRETNPLLKKEDIINFSNFYSSGTSTAVSVPSMFSIYSRKQYNAKKIQHTENVLDILKHAGINVLWRDNNSNSKGVASRVKYEDLRHCDKLGCSNEYECNDEVLLDKLQKYIDANEQNMFIVLHQKGCHGPAYYKRYPKEFTKFKPVRKSSHLTKTSNQEMINAYDNTILYTDYFLSKVIKILKANSKQYNTAMMYIADHGESLGEHGLYLHGLPYSIAPDCQKHVGAFMWFNKEFPIDRSHLMKQRSKKYSHDNLFNSILGIFEVQTAVYDKNLDIFYKK